jgi:Carboxypeptidase regulatory-like domain
MDVCRAERKVLSIVLLASATLGLGCAVRSYHDYTFGVTGLVTAEDGAPVQNAQITLEVNGPVYAAITAVKTARQFTGSSGGFIFMYISHERGVKYTITVHKAGFEPQTVSGSAPPDGHLEIHLKRASGDGIAAR